MSDASSTDDRSRPTLYNPPSSDDTSALADDARVSLSIDLPPEVYDRLQDVAQQLGLPADVVAARAVEMICNELPKMTPGAESSDAPSAEPDASPPDSGDITDDTDSSPSQRPSTQELIDRYQSRLDLLRATLDD